MWQTEEIHASKGYKDILTSEKNTYIIENETMVFQG